MKKSVLITQSNYIPWKGYFDAINAVDEFVILDEVQYTRRDWRNRNRIVTPTGVRWLTIPVHVRGKYHQTINEAQVADPSWNRKHWQIIAQHYSRRPNFDAVADFVANLYDTGEERQLSIINERFIRGICSWLGIDTAITRSRDRSLAPGRNRRLIDLCQQVGAGRYFTGPAAKSYLNEDAFREAGIDVHWLDFQGYRPYPQATETFDHHVTILDMLFNVGDRARDYMKTFRCQSN